MNLKKTALVTALAAAVGAPAVATADIIVTLSYTGFFTMITSTGMGALNNTDFTGSPGYGRRTPITGTMNFNLSNGSGGGTLTGFSFFGGGAAEATTISFQAIGDAMGRGPIGSR